MLAGLPGNDLLTSDDGRCQTSVKRCTDRRHCRAGKADLHDLAIIHRLLHDYMGRRWNRLVVAGLCMIVTATMNGVLAWLLDPATKQIFLDNNAECCPLFRLQSLASSLYAP